MLNRFPAGLILGSLVAFSALAQSALPPVSAGFGEADFWPNRAGSIDRPLRYRPDGGDFVIHNGTARFNRPLYAARTGFRVDAGDRPEFALNLPRKGGVLRLGVAGPTPLWLHEAATVEMRYRPGSVIYTVRDPALADTTLTVTVQAVRERTAALWRFEADGSLPGALVWSFTGGDSRSANARNGDIIAERDPAEIMLPTRGDAVGNVVAVGLNRYVNRAGAFDFRQAPTGASGAVEFEAWDRVPDPTQWAIGTPLAAPVFQGSLSVQVGEPTYLGIFATSPEAAFSTAELATLWTETEAARAALTARVTIDTPDPFINAAPGALLVAADAVWDPPNMLHGAIAWRLPLLGWRGPAALDALGWHDRFRAYARHWIAQQNVDPTDLPAQPQADPAKNLATDDWRALHGYGSIPARHYDMALGFVDLLLRHLMWTGDIEFAREVWPFLERHLAWEKRCFDRDGLYEGYAAIWASDALTYNGGGTAHASALNYWHRVMAARIATLVDADPTPHVAEAARIWSAMQTRLGLRDTGSLAEYVERAGLQRPHFDAALWTFYHAVDSQAVTPQQALFLAGELATRRERIPVRGPGVPEGGWVWSTTDWQPYEWSLNNVVPAENAHTALALWQAGRPDLAWSLWQGTLLDAMYLGMSPGNIPNLSHYDGHRRETYRDFADPIGTFSRALVEGLFGVRPDGLKGELVLAPGFPADWNHAALHTPDFDWRYQRENDVDTWVWQGSCPGVKSLRLRVPARGATVARLEINGTRVAPPPVEKDDRSAGWVEFTTGMTERVAVRIAWAGAPSEPFEDGAPGLSAAPVGLDSPPVGLAWEPVDLNAVRHDRVEQIFSRDYLSPRSPYVSLSLPKQGLGSWSDFKATAELDDAGAVGHVASPLGGAFELPPERASPNVAFVSWWDNFPVAQTVPLNGAAQALQVLVAGSTSPMQSQIDNGEIVVTYADGSTAVLPLHNPTTWWPIERDYVIDDFAFRRRGQVPWRLELATGRFYQPDGRGGHPRGGAATVLSLPLDPTKPLQSLTVRALSTEVVVGLMAASLAR